MNNKYQYSLNLSERLQEIDNMVTASYDNIWDCCCDHGLLGFSLLARQAAANIHFVDIVPELMNSLEEKLTKHHQPDINKSSWHSHCINVEDLPLADYAGNHLLIIAGVGGDLMIKFIEAINKRYSTKKISLLLCPVHHQYSLRVKLKTLGFTLEDEVLIKENQRFYEILKVTNSNDIATEVSPIGDKIWYTSNAEQNMLALSYLRKTLSHYRKVQQGLSKKLLNITDKKASELAVKLQTQLDEIDGVINHYQAIEQRLLM